MRVAIHTLGCKVNQYETQAMEEILRARGHTLTAFEEAADLYIVNSCTVTAVSDKKSRQAVRQARKRAPHAVVAVCGCYPQVSPEDAAKLDADLIGGSGNRIDFINRLEAIAESRTKTVLVDHAMERRDFEYLPAGGLAGRTRAMLKVEDGCTNFCAYCIIPYARGPVRSLPLPKAAEEAQRLQNEGYRELVLTGIELSSYGRDLEDKPSTTDLIETVCLAAPELRIRLGSLEPRTVTAEFCERLSKLPNLCPNFHLSLQSGCDETLKRMKRRYTIERYLESVALLRQYFENPGVTTDLIVGFPGETEAEFIQTLAFLQRCQFSGMHIFPYSRRTGTPAATMPNQLSNAVKAERVHRATAVSQAMQQSYLTSFIGKTAPVLFEEERDGVFRGYTPQYIEVHSKGKELHNVMKQVKMITAEQSYLFGAIEEENT